MSSLTHWILFPAITMSLGWGLRGYIGGGPLGAMIPGAMVAMALCILVGRRNPAWNGVAAAFGAVGVGFGGQMTYGQTIGLSVQPATAVWGMSGLALKGAIWGLLGASVIATGLVAPRLLRRKRVVTSCIALVAMCATGWRLINDPKLIYFSDPVNHPRPEIWAGLLLAAIAFLVLIQQPIVWDFAWIGTLGGGIGFGLGGWLNAMGRTSGWPAPVDWWKIMELTFGFLFGAALGYAAWRWRDALASDGIEIGAAERPRWTFFALLPLCALTVAAEEGLGFRFTYMVAGAALLALSSWHARFAWQAAVTTTVIAFAVDFLQSRAAWQQPVLLWVVVCAVGAATAMLVDRNRARLRWMLLYLTWLAVADSYAKAWLLPANAFSWPHFYVELAFTLMALAVSGYVYASVRRPDLAIGTLRGAEIKA